MQEKDFLETGTNKQPLRKLTTWATTAMILLLLGAPFIGIGFLLGWLIWR